MRYTWYRGFTLVEVMIVSTISFIIIGASLTFFIRGFRAVDTGEKAVELQEELNRAFIWMSDDLKQTSRAVIDLPADGQWHNSVSFKVPLEVAFGKLVWSTEKITYGLIVDGLSRTYGAEKMTVAHSLTEVWFRRLATNPGQVEVRLTATGQTPFGSMDDSLEFRVTMRNQ